MTEPSKFKSIDVLRQNAEIGGQSVIRINVQVFYQEALSLDTRDVKMNVRVPISAGYLKSSSCTASYRGPSSDACKLL